MEVLEEKERITGFRPDAHNPTVPSPPLELTSEQLPLQVLFNGRRYVIRDTKNGGLIMNGA
jgi:hypothetical protein